MMGCPKSMKNQTAEELEIMSPRARRLIKSIRTKEHLSGTKLFEEIQEILNPEILFHQEVSPWRNIWPGLQTFLFQRQVPLTVHAQR